jgi:hypothetical protein
VSKVNPVYGKTRVKIDLRDRETQSALKYSDAQVKPVGRVGIYIKNIYRSCLQGRAFSASIDNTVITAILEILQALLA